MLERLARFLIGADAPTESDSQRNGLLSYSAEWHALLIGAGAGSITQLTSNPELAAAVIAVALGGQAAQAASSHLQGRGVVRQIRREPWYAIAGVLLGYTLGLVV